jgi:hypothetical protein
VATAWTRVPATYHVAQEEEIMTAVDKLWAALGKAIAANASTKQVNGIAARLARASGQRT